MTIAQQDHLVSPNNGRTDREGNFLCQNALLIGRILLSQYSKLRLRNDPPELIFTVAVDQKHLYIATRGADHCHWSLLCLRDWTGTFAKLTLN